jgi:Glycosyl hydrolases family 15
MTATETGWDVQRTLLDYLEGAWNQPDNSLWEMRGPRRQFVHSKVMAWAGFDRAMQAVQRHGLDGPVHRWRALRDQIHADVCRHGFDPDSIWTERTVDLPRASPSPKAAGPRGLPLRRGGSCRSRWGGTDADRASPAGQALAHRCPAHRVGPAAAWRRRIRTVRRR